VQATDNVRVTRVRVTVLDEAGKIVETGEATRTRGNRWEYASRAKGCTITAEAWDLPGNLTNKELNLNH
jgi:hypothetical protein